MIIGINGEAGAGKDTVAAYLAQAYGFMRLPFAKPLKDACMAAFGFTRAQVYTEQKEAPVPVGTLKIRDAETCKDQSGVMCAVAFQMSFDEWSLQGERHFKQLKRYPFESPHLIKDKIQGQMRKVFEPLIWGDKKDPWDTTISPRVVLQLVGTEVFRELWQDVWINLWSQQAINYKSVVAADLRFDNEADAIRALSGKVLRVHDPLGRYKMSSRGHVSEKGLAYAPDYVLTNDGSFDQLHDAADLAIQKLFPSPVPTAAV